MDSCLAFSLLRFLDFSSSSARLELVSASRSSVSFLSCGDVGVKEANAEHHAAAPPGSSGLLLPSTFCSLRFWPSTISTSFSSFLAFSSTEVFSSCSRWQASSSSAICASSSCSGRTDRFSDGVVRIYNTRICFMSNIIYIIIYFPV